MTATMLEERVDTVTKPDSGDSPCTHIVLPPPGSKLSPQAYVLQARVEGAVIEALCGHRWIPSRDPKQYPICQPCREIYEQPGEQRDSRNELPDA